MAALMRDPDAWVDEYQNPAEDAELEAQEKSGLCPWCQHFPNGVVLPCRECEGEFFDTPSEPPAPVAVEAASCMEHRCECGRYVQRAGMLCEKCEEGW
jgi:hypothetical protein